MFWVKSINTIYQCAVFGYLFSCFIHLFTMLSVDIWLVYISSFKIIFITVKYNMHVYIICQYWNSLKQTLKMIYNRDQHVSQHLNSLTNLIYITYLYVYCTQHFHYQRQGRIYSNICLSLHVHALLLSTVLLNKAYISLF